MKKVLAIAAIVMLVPFTAFGMQMMADTALEDVTGQAGVSISIDNVQMDFQMDYLSWGDGDGLGNGLGAGYVNLTDIRMTNIVIDKLGIGASEIAPLAFTIDPGTTYTEIIEGDGDLTNGWDGVARQMDIVPTDGASDLAFLTIDVGTAGILDAAGGLGTATDTVVKIGIPTLTIYVGEIAPFDIRLDAQAGDDLTTTADVLGSIAVGGMQLDTKGGSIAILAH